MKDYGFVRVGSIVPEMRVANPAWNAAEIIKELKKANSAGIQLAVLPELALTGYTCGDLFAQEFLLDAAAEGLTEIAKATAHLDIAVILGLPVKNGNKLFNCAAVLEGGKILGFVPKTYLPNYGEFYEKRWFASAREPYKNEIDSVPFGTDLIFDSGAFSFGVEICEDLWAVSPPSNKLAEAGALVVFNLSASNELIGKREYRRELVRSQSARLISAYVYASAGANESTADLLFGGHAIIAENGVILRENERFSFESGFISADIDIQRLSNERMKNMTYFNGDETLRKVKIDVTPYPGKLCRDYSKTPFVPGDDEKREARCREILDIQSCALARRLRHMGIKKCVVGLSGGLDSLLAFLVIVEAYKKLDIHNENLIAVTMPGFGTTARTRGNAVSVARNFGAELRNIDIKQAVSRHLADIKHDEEIHDITYENAQARERTQILMDIANKENALVVGTGDLSELALGWCTYNGDHMSMYAVNCGVPKTLVRWIVKYIADTTKSEVLLDILDTPVSPELLPPSKDGEILQKTEDSIGPYILHDFFLYHFLRYGASPEKIKFLAEHAFRGEYGAAEIQKWLDVFLRRFFQNQFKRNCVPDGVKVGTISLSPRGDLRMPSEVKWNGHEPNTPHSRLRP